MFEPTGPVSGWLEDKYHRLKESLRSMGGVVVAYSGGMDSALVMKVAHDELGVRMLAVTLHSEVYTDKETEEARQLALSLGIPHEVIVNKDLDNEDFAENSPLLRSKF